MKFLADLVTFTEESLTGNLIFCAALDLCQTSKIEVFVKMINGLKPLNIFAKSFVLDV